LAVTTDQVATPIGRIGLLAKMIPSAKSEVGAAVTSPSHEPEKQLVKHTLGC
jgi:hypothetical protein